MDAEPKPVKVTKPNYTIPLLLFVIFFAPLILAYVIFFNRGEGMDMETLNRGKLLNPPWQVSQFDLQGSIGKALPKNTFSGKWSALYITEHCFKDCQAELYQLRQVRTALGRDRNRLQTFLVTNDDPALLTSTIENYPNLQFAYMDQKHLNNIPNLANTRLFLVDPNGNVMMTYNNVSQPRDVYVDLKRLLKASNIG